MRKLFWYGCAAVAVGAAGVFWAAKWAERHPQATAADYARIPWHMLTDWNPVVQVGKEMGARTVELFQGPKPPPAPPVAVAPACPADPGVASPPPIVDVIDISEDLQLSQLGDSPEYAPSWESGLQREIADALQDGVETVLPGDIEEAELPIKSYMPAADEDETPAVQPTKLENLADLSDIFQDSDEASAMDAETLPMPRVEDADEDDAEAKPAEDVKEEIPMPDEYQVQLGEPTPEQFGQIMSDEAMKQLALQAAGVRIIINEEEEFVPANKVDGQASDAEPEPEVLPMPEEENEAINEAGEESEAMQPGKPSDCREVPNIEQRCPECPAGGCPRR